MKTSILKLMLLTFSTSVIFIACKKESRIERMEGYEICKPNTYFKINVYDTLNNFLYSDSISTTGCIAVKRNWSGPYSNNYRLNITSCGKDSNTANPSIDTTNHLFTFYYLNLIKGIYDNNESGNILYGVSGQTKIYNNPNIPVLPAISCTYTESYGYLHGSFPKTEFYKVSGTWDKVLISGSFRANINVVN